MKTTGIAAIAASLLLLAGCGTNDRAAPSAATDSPGTVLQLPAGGSNIESINGVAVPETLLDAVAKGRGLDLAQATQKQQALDELQQYVLLAQQAPALKVQEQPDLAALVEAARLQGMANAVLLAYARSHPVTDQQIDKEYRDQIGRVGNTTYRITQLLFADEATADKAAAELAAGKSFDEVFKAYQGKARDARAYPDMFLKQFPPELASAVAALQPGQVTPKPVKSALGWHLVQLVATQPFDPPPLEKVAPQIREALQQKQAQAYIESLKANATITLEAPANAASAGPAAALPGMGKAVSKQVVKQTDPATSESSH